MDIRIVNICNNDCIYCLEQSYRKKEKFLDKNKILKKILDSNKKNITFYWGNPFLHPDFYEIVSYLRKNKIDSIWVLTNTYWLTNNILEDKLINYFWIYFNSFNEKIHNLICNWWISLEELINNIIRIKKSKIELKIIININKQNIKTIARDIIILRKKFSITKFEFINYFPFDRPYDIYKDLLFYNIEEEKDNIEKIFKVIKKLNLDVLFFKFPKNFFISNPEFYNYKSWILKQIWEEDIERLKDNPPFCSIEKRCKYCFIQDNCEYINNK